MSSDSLLLPPPTPRLRDRLAARWAAHRLDAALAAGAPAESAAALAARAQRLTALQRRRLIACAIRRVVHEAEEGPRLALARIGPWTPRVAAACEELTRLADALDRPGP